MAHGKIVQKGPDPNCIIFAKKGGREEVVLK
jgi:hypothetical protein